MPAAFFFLRSLRRSSSFCWYGFPEYFSDKTMTFSVGRGGLSVQIISTRFSETPTNVACDFFFSVSLSLRASEAVITVGSTPTVFPPSACSVILISAQFLYLSGRVLLVPFLPSRNIFHALAQQMPVF